jgi:hypothetical protein
LPINSRSLCYISDEPAPTPPSRRSTTRTLHIQTFKHSHPPTHKQLKMAGAGNAKQADAKATKATPAAAPAAKKGGEDKAPAKAAAPAAAKGGAAKK